MVTEGAHWPSGQPRSAAILFDDRVDAGGRLAKRLESLRSQDIVVLGLVRGGVRVALEGIVKLFENACGSIDVSGLYGGT